MAAVCAELDIAIVAHTPLGRGMLSGRFKSAGDIPPPTDMLSRFPRFQPGNFEKNLEIVHEIGKLADKKNVTKV